MTSSFKISALAWVVTICLLYGCNKTNPDVTPVVPTPPVTPTPAYDVYIAGSGGAFTKTAFVWKNDIPTTLSTNGFGNGIYVSGSDVYVAGASGDSAVVWKNGIATYLASGATAYSVFVAGTDVYVAGLVGSSAALWKNGTVSILAAIGVCRSVFVNGADVYALGSDNSGNQVYWKNGVPTKVNYAPNTSGVCTSIYVSGSDVFVCGNFRNNSGPANPQATYWKNGTQVNLPSPTTFVNSTSNSIFISGSDVYVAGFASSNGSSATERAILWKNGTANILSSGPNGEEANSVFVIDNDVYVTGSGGGFAERRLWKNGIEVSKPAGVGTGVFVVKR